MVQVQLVQNNTNARGLERLTIFLRFFALTGFPSLSFFFASFFFLGRPFFLHGTSLSDTSGCASASSGERGEWKCELSESDERIISLPPGLIPAENN